MQNIKQAKILLIAIGSRGDIEPFLAVGALLKQSGFDNLRCCFPEQFAHLAEEEGFPFYSLGTKFLELLETSDGKDIMGGDLSRIAKLKLYWKLYQGTKELHDTHMQIEQDAIEDFNPDLIIYHVKSIYPTAWEVLNPRKTLMLSPVPCIVKPTSSYPTLGIPFTLGERFNRWTYKLTGAAIVKTVLTYNKRMVKPLEVTKKAVKRVYSETPMIFTISPSLFPRDERWGPETHLVGYQERNKTQHWDPPQDFVDFLQRNAKVMLLTFGSMNNPDPEGKTRLLTDLLAKHRIPTVINTAAGGLVNLSTLDPELFHIVERVPYDWLLPQVYGVIHHGGSGTTHLAAKYGCVSMIIPHIVDQFLWNKIVANSGMGPSGIGVSKLKPSIEDSIVDLYQNPKYKTAALNISAEMLRQEDNGKSVVTLISNHLIKNLRGISPA